MKNALLLCSVLLSVACATGPRPHVPDAPMPRKELVQADFAKVFEVRATSNSVTAAAPDKSLLKRVMLSPNLVFESSRSSVREPEVSGPRGDRAPSLPDALGRPVEPWLSSQLMAELVARGATLVAPAMSRSLGDVCDEGKCSFGTWVERVLFRYQRAAASAKGAEELGELPTSLLAVRELGLFWYESEVVADRAENGDLVFRPRRSPGEASACPTVKVELPVVRFSAEVLGLRDGRILARIDEATSPPVKITLKRQVEAATFSPVRETDFDGVSRYSRVTRWDSKDVSCQGAVAAYAEIREKARLEMDVIALARELVWTGLNRLAAK
jgi:hypothetical protein